MIGVNIWRPGRLTNHIRQSLKFAFIVLFVFTAAALFHSDKVFAASLGMSPNPQGQMPSTEYNYLYNCPNTYPSSHESPAYTEWLSPAGKPTASLTTVPPGTKTVNLQLNFSGAYCDYVTSISGTEQKVTKTSTGVNNLKNSILSMSWPGDVTGCGSPGCYPYRGTLKSFSYTLPGGGSFPQGTHTYTIDVYTSTINSWRNGTYFSCVDPGSTPGNIGSYNFSACNATHLSLSFQVVVARVHPKGTLSVKCINPGVAGQATGTFSDPFGPTSAYITAGSVTYSTTNKSPYTWSGIPIPASGSTTVTLFVDDVGGTNKFVPVDSASLSNSTCLPSPSIGCNGQNTKPNISLPPAAPNNPAPTGASSTPNAIYEQDIPGNYQINDAYDEYSPPTHITWSPTGQQASNNFTLDYANFVNQYPYDHHQPTVYYQQYYQSKYWSSSSSPDYYTCPSGWSGGGTSSQCSYSYSPTYTCPSGETYFGPPATTPGCYTYYPQGATGSCAPLVNAQCYDGPGTPNCNSGDSLSNGTCTSTSNATPWYNWHDPGYFNNVSAASTYSAPYLNRCYNRNFDVQAPSQTDVTNVSFDNNENPTSVTIGTQTTVLFSLQSPAGIKSLRLGMGVTGLNYDATYYIEHIDGTFQPLTGLPSPVTFPLIGGSVMNSGDTASYDYSASTAVSLPPLLVGDKVCAEFTISPSSGLVDEFGNIQSGDGSVDSTRIPITPTCSAPVTNEPYVRFYGNDVLAGAQFPGPGNSCKTNATIKTFNRGSGSQSLGSGSQFAALSLGQIEQFASAFLRNAVPTSLTGLTFANTTAGGLAGNGNFNSACTTLPDYFNNDRPNDAINTNVSDIGSVAAPVISSKAYYSSSGGSLNSFIIPNGSSISVFVKGDVYITGNITYNTAGWGYDSTNGTTNVPSFYLIVSGNIDIAPGVTQLDGVYVAQPNGVNSGIIRTCSAASNTPYDPNSLYTTCNSQLTINGSFVAQDVKFDRSFSSLRHSQAGENPFSSPNAFPAHACDPSGSPVQSDCSAEVFNFSPELYLNNPSLNPGAGPTLNKYDYITSLAPVL